MDFGAFGAADPVSLHFLEGVGPVDGVEVVEEALGVGGDAEHPLAHRFANDGETADFAFAIDHFFVGEDGAEFGAPVDRGFGDVGEAFGIAVLAFLFLGLACGWVRQRFDGSALFVAGLNHEL